MIASLVEKTAVRVGISPLEMKRFVKFGVVGVMGAIVDFGVFNILRAIFLGMAIEGSSMALPILGMVDTATTLLSLASAISFAAAIVSNFVWNRYWTYPDSRSKSLRRQFVQFFVVNFLGIVIRIPVVAFTHGLFESLTRWALPSVGDETAALLGDNLALVLAVGIVMFWNFFVNRYWTYGDVDTINEVAKVDTQD